MSSYCRDLSLGRFVAIVAALVVCMGLVQSADAAPNQSQSTGYEYLVAGLSCDYLGHVLSYNGTMVDGSRDRRIEYYFNFAQANGAVSYSHNVSTVYTTDTGSYKTSTYDFYMSTYTAIQFNVYYPYPDDHLYQSQWRYCNGGPAIANGSSVTAQTHP